METECTAPDSPDCVEEGNCGFASFKEFQFDRNFKSRKIAQLVVPGRTWNYTSPKNGKTVFHEFLAWYWDNHQAVLVKKAKSESDSRYAESESDLRKHRAGLDYYKISETCHIDQRFSLADTCKEMQKLLKEAYGDELDETSGIRWEKN